MGKVWAPPKDMATQMEMGSGKAQVEISKPSPRAGDKCLMDWLIESARLHLPEPPIEPPIGLLLEFSAGIRNPW